jgi:hypothetical protein
MTDHLVRNDLQNIIGDIVETDDDDVSNAIERHRSTLNDHDRRKSMIDVAKTRELEQLRLTTGRLIDELDSVRKQNAETVRARVASEAAFHEQRLDCVRLQQELDTSSHHAVELRRRVESLEVEKKHLCELLESRVNALKKKQRAFKDFVFFAETRERCLLMDQESDSRNHIQFQKWVYPSTKQPKQFDREIVLIGTLERLERNDLEQDELKNRQTLQNRLAYVRRGILQLASPQRTLERGTVSRKSPATDRPWYPPGSARIPSTPSVRRSHSPASTKSETPQRLPAQAALSRMQHLLTSLSAWPEYAPE